MDFRKWGARIPFDGKLEEKIRPIVNLYRYIIFFSAFVLSTFALAAPVSADALTSTLLSKMALTTSALSSKAMGALASFAALQWVITNIGLLKSGADIDAVFGKMIGSLMWIGVCIYILINGPSFINNVGNEYFDTPGLSFPTIGTILSNTATTAGLIAAASIPIGAFSDSAGSLLVNLLLCVVAVGCFFAFKIFMLQLELGLIIMLAPLSFAFLGLNALRDQGIAPFKALISLVYRIVLIGVLMSAFTAVDMGVRQAFAGFTLANVMDGLGSIFESLMAAAGTYLLLAYLLFKSDAIAASLASGSTSMGTADVASAAAAGAAAGAAVGALSGGVSPSKPVQLMFDFMKNLGGGGTKVSNAGGVGSGGSQSRGGLDPMPMASVADAPMLPDSPPPPYETGSSGQPLPPSQPSNVASSPAASGGGSGQTAGIGAGGDASALTKTLQSIESHLAPKTAGVGDRLKDVNQHIAQEKAATHVSINTHHSD